MCGPATSRRMALFRLTPRLVVLMTVLLSAVPMSASAQTSLPASKPPNAATNTSTQWLDEIDARRGLPSPGQTWTAPKPLPAWLEAAESHAAKIDRLRMALRQPMEVEFAATPLRKAMQNISEKCQILFYINPLELDLLGVDPDTPVTLTSLTASVNEVLDLLLNPLELSYQIREIGVEITSRDAANSDPAVRYYDMAWVIGESDQAKSMVDAVEMTIDPDSWLTAGGTSHIQVLGSILIISAPETTQRKIESLFANLLRLKKESSKESVAAEATIE